MLTRNLDVCTTLSASSLDNLHLQTDLGALDFLGAMTGVGGYEGGYEQVQANALEVELFGQRVRVMSLADLIQSRRTLQRDKDLLAVKELLAIREQLRSR